MTAARQRLGAEGEDRAAWWYHHRGFEIVDRNWRCGDGELDLLCRQGSVLVVCEVKARRSLDYGHPAEAVGWAKQQRIRRLAARWLRESGVEGIEEVRFDVAAVLPGSVDVIEGAF